jgi:hypothetical protein
MRLPFHHIFLWQGKNKMRASVAGILLWSSQKYVIGTRKIVEKTSTSVT